MSWQDHMTQGERDWLVNACQERHYHRTIAADMGKEIAKLRNTCVQRASRKAKSDA